jgi:hypothetical protein
LPWKPCAHDRGKVIAVFGSAGLRSGKARADGRDFPGADLTVLTAEDRSESLDIILDEMALARSRRREDDPSAPDHGAIWFGLRYAAGMWSSHGSEYE